MSYSPYDYARMLADRRRIETYCAALERSVRADSVVLDIGSGIGLFALLAAKLGARRVIAVDPNSAISLLSTIAREQGVSVEVHQARSQDLVLEERADVLVFDVRGALPLYGDSLATIADAVNRLLKPDGILLPEVDALWMVPVSCEALYREKRCPWGQTNLPVNLSSVSHRCLNQWYREPLRQEYVIAPAKEWVRIDYRRVTSDSLRAACSFLVEDRAMMHGFFLYAQVQFPFDLEYVCDTPEAVCVSGSAFFPLRDELSLEAGDTVTCQLEARLVGGEYVWQWQTQVHRGGVLQTEFLQNTLASRVGSLESLAPVLSTFTPRDTAKAQAARWVLSAFNGVNSLASIAPELVKRFPSEFPSERAAMDFVARLSRRYGVE